MSLETLHHRLPQYRYIRISESDPVQKSQDNIFYIGDNQGLLATFAESMQSGYSSAVNFQQAMSFLKELQKEQYQFNSILIDLPYHKIQHKQFLKYINNSSYSQLPLIYVSSHLTDADTRELTEGNLVDEIIHPVRDIFTIGERIQFFSKVKKATMTKGARFSIEKSSADHYRHTDVYKRIFDILFASVLLVFAAPLMLVIALLIKLDSKGPVLYNSYRAGRGYRIFKFYKFRTMKVGADRLVSSLSHINLYQNTETHFFKACDDPRITRIGAFLRQSSLDELPQLFNVLKGDMSIVGNRPLPLYEAASLTTDEWAERFTAPAGLTGLWQVAKNRNTEMSSEERIDMDICYARNYNLLLDLKIILKTPRALIQGQNQ